MGNKPAACMWREDAGEVTTKPSSCFALSGKQDVVGFLTSRFGSRYKLSLYSWAGHEHLGGKPATLVPRCCASLCFGPVVSLPSERGFGVLPWLSLAPMPVQARVLWPVTALW